jgi:hypothetical protein
MVILKGIGLGLVLFGVTLAIYITAFTRFVMQNAGPSAGVVGIDFVSALKHNPAILAAFLACVALGVSIVAMWPRHA